MNFTRGVILKGIGGFYYVKCDEKIYECRARGKFRLDGIKPIPGDIAEITPPTDISGGYIEDIVKRKNELVRPSVANLDSLLIVLSAKKPKPDFLLADKLLIYAKYNHIPCAIVINKCDSGVANDIKKQYEKSGVDVLSVSAHTREGFRCLKSSLKASVSALQGNPRWGNPLSLIRCFPTSILRREGFLKRRIGEGIRQGTQS